MLKLLNTSLLYLYDSVIQNIADSRPKVRYLIAKDDTQTTLEEIVKVYLSFVKFLLRLLSTKNFEF